MFDEFVRTFITLTVEENSKEENKLPNNINEIAKVGQILLTNKKDTSLKLLWDYILCQSNNQDMLKELLQNIDKNTERKPPCLISLIQARERYLYPIISKGKPILDLMQQEYYEKQMQMYKEQNAELTRLQKRLLIAHTVLSLLSALKKRMVYLAHSLCG